VESQGGTVCGAAPTGVAAREDAVYVALAHQDSVAKVSPDGTQVISETPLTPFTGERFQDRYIGHRGSEHACSFSNVF
jgi:hypothetical protein